MCPLSWITAPDYLKTNLCAAVKKKNIADVIKGPKPLTLREIIQII